MPGRKLLVRQYRMMFRWCRWRSDQIHVRVPSSGANAPPLVASAKPIIQRVDFGLTCSTRLPGSIIFASSAR